MVALRTERLWPGFLHGATGRTSIHRARRRPGNMRPDTASGWQRGGVCSAAPRTTRIGIRSYKAELGGEDVGFGAGVAVSPGRACSLDRIWISAAPTWMP